MWNAKILGTLVRFARGTSENQTQTVSKEIREVILNWITILLLRPEQRLNSFYVTMRRVVVAHCGENYPELEELPEREEVLQWGLSDLSTQQLIKLIVSPDYLRDMIWFLRDKAVDQDWYAELCRKEEGIIEED